VDHPPEGLPAEAGRRIEAARRRWVCGGGHEFFLWRLSLV
jgi:hypothetical protein